MMNDIFYKKIISSTASAVKKAINNYSQDSFELYEGIDFDEYNREVWYVPEEINIDTSLETNPTKWCKNINTDIEVWSIFKRKNSKYDTKYSIFDGNPLLYAFKNEKHWHFRNNKDRNIILALLEKLIDKFLETHNTDITIVLPSGNTLNTLFASYIKSKNRNITIINDLIRKLSCTEVWEILEEPGSAFRNEFGKNRYSWNKAKTFMFSAFDKMKSMRDGKFTYHLIPETDEGYRDFITNTLTIEDYSIAKYAGDLYNKNILIIDDSISRGQTVKNACDIIDSFMPKSITVLTMFSPKYDED